jgi:hypothetical protein
MTAVHLRPDWLIGAADHGSFLLKQGKLSDDLPSSAGKRTASLAAGEEENLRNHRWPQMATDKKKGKKREVDGWAALGFATQVGMENS